MKNTCPRKCVSVLTAFLFMVASIPVRPSAAQELYQLPVPGSMVLPTPNFLPPLIKGITIHPGNPLQFDFIVHNGETDIQGTELEEESLKQIKYFLAAMTIPETNMWVNLSPFESHRIISEDFGATEMGKDLLMQDYILKQLTASLIYPEEEVGKKFWERTYKRAYELLGTTEIPINTFNKVWIVPDKAVVYERNNTVFVLESRLKVMWEEDYLASKSELNNERFERPSEESPELEQLSAENARIVREVLIPEIEREVNEGETFVELRQIYHSMILAAWYKTHLKNTLLGQVYADKAKTKGVQVADPAINEKIYERYLDAYQKGVYNFMRDEYDSMTQEVTSRVYFSGGFDPAMMSSEVLEVIDAQSPAALADFAALNRERDKLDLIGVELEETDLEQVVGSDQAMIGDVRLMRIDANTELAADVARQVQAELSAIPYSFILKGYIAMLSSRLTALQRESDRNYLIAQGISPQVVTEAAAENARDNKPEIERIEALMGNIRSELARRSQLSADTAMLTRADVVRRNADKLHSMEFESILVDVSMGGPALGDRGIAVRGLATGEGLILEFSRWQTEAQQQKLEQLRQQGIDVHEFVVASRVTNLIQGLYTMESVQMIKQDQPNGASVQEILSESIRERNRRDETSDVRGAPRTDEAMLAEPTPVGGIDFDPALLNLQIKRDGSGIALQADQQDFSTIKIDGLFPVIVSIVPVTELPLQLSEMFPSDSTVGPAI